MDFAHTECRSIIVHHCHVVVMSSAIVFTAECSVLELPLVAYGQALAVAARSCNDCKYLQSSSRALTWHPPVSAQASCSPLATGRRPRGCSMSAMRCSHILNNSCTRNIGVTAAVAPVPSLWLWLSCTCACACARPDLRPGPRYSGPSGISKTAFCMRCHCSAS